MTRVDASDDSWLKPSSFARICVEREGTRLASVDGAMANWRALERRYLVAAGREVQGSPVLCVVYLGHVRELRHDVRLLVVDLVLERQGEDGAVVAEATETGRGGDRPAAHDSGQVGEEHGAGGL